MHHVHLNCYAKLCFASLTLLDLFQPGPYSPPPPLSPSLDRHNGLNSKAYALRTSDTKTFLLPPTPHFVWSSPTNE